MRRFFVGLFWGLVIGLLFAWLYERFLRVRRKTWIAPPYHVEERPPDDLTILRGIGPAFAERLHQAGIRTFAQLAQLTPEEAAALCRVPLGRVLRNDWVGQAAARKE